jgi:hypothetical protein
LATATPFGSGLSPPRAVGLPIRCSAAECTLAISSAAAASGLPGLSGAAVEGGELRALVKKKRKADAPSMVMSVAEAWLGVIPAAWHFLRWGSGREGVETIVEKR